MRIIPLATLALLIMSCRVAPLPQGSADSRVLNYCEVTKEPLKYQGEIVAVKGLYLRRSKTSNFGDRACDQNWSWAEFDPSFQTQSDPSALKIFNKKVVDFDGVTIVVKGIIEGPAYPGSFDSYGHNESCKFKFTVHSIVSAE